MAEILSGEGIHHKTAYTGDDGRSQYAVVQSDGSSMRVSKALFSALDKVPDGRSESQLIAVQLRRIEQRQKVLRAEGTRAGSWDRRLQIRQEVARLTEQHERAREEYRDARRREDAAEVAARGTVEQREERRRQEVAERERQARIGP